MQVIVYQMRRNGVEIARELLGDEARNIGELRVGIFEDGDLAKLATVDFAIVKELAAEIVEFSGLQGVEDAAKKS